LDAEVILLTLVSDSGRLCLEAIKELVELGAVEHHAVALLHGREVRAPLRIEGALPHAHVLDRLCVAEAAFHCSLLRVDRRLEVPRIAQSGLFTLMCLLCFARFSLCGGFLFRLDRCFMSVACMRPHDRTGE
jgi:hypothetical protein